MFKFVHAADIHLDIPMRGLERYEGAPLEEIRGATRRAFENLTELAIEEQVELEAVAEDPWIVFPGNTQVRHARETGSKGCSLVTVDEGRVAWVEHRCLDVVRWSVGSVEVTEATTLDEVHDGVGRSLAEASGEAEGRPVAARLRFYGACPLHTRLRAAGERVVNECRSIASAGGSGDLWVEKVLLDKGQDLQRRFPG